VPDGHGVHAALPACAKVPAGQLPQTVLLEAVQTLVGAWPAAQTRQSSHWAAPVLVVKEPAGQAVHGPDEAATAYAPTAQALQTTSFVTLHGVDWK
jgi:hypothetical protein